VVSQATRSGERTLATLSLPDFALHRGWYVARALFRGSTNPRTGSGRELCLLNVPQEQRQRVVEDRRRITVGNRVTE
jgi:hypothetical protein